MLKKTIKYTDYDGNEREEDFYFHLTKAEVVDWLTTSREDSLDKVMEKIVRTNNKRELVDIFKDFIYRSYGEKSLDGRRFIKTKEVKDNFTETEAYSELYLELLGDAKAAADFFNGVIPSDLAKEINDVMKDPDNIPPEIAERMGDIVSFNQ